MNAIEFKAIQKLCVENEPWNDSLGGLLGLHKSYVSGRIETVYDGGQIIGYCEWWRIEESQILDILNNRFSVLRDNFQNGPVLWIANVTIDKRYRHGRTIIKTLKSRVFSKNEDAEFVGGNYYGTRKRNKKYKLIRMKKAVIQNGR